MKKIIQTNTTRIKSTNRNIKRNSKKVSLSSICIFKKGIRGIVTDKIKIKPIKGNRGLETPIERKRVEKHKNDILNGNYIDLGQDVTINIYGEIVDGNHRYVAFKELINEGHKMDIRYYVTSDEELNSTDSNIRWIRTSYLNCHNPQWTKLGTYKGSVNRGLPLAEAIKNLIDKISSETKIPTNKIETSWVFSLIKKDIKFFSASKELNSAATFNNKELANYTKTEDFKIDFENFIELIKIFQKKYTRYNNITKYILHLHWTNQNFDINKMFTNLKKYKFILPDGFKTKDIKNEIFRIYNMKKSYTNLTHLF